MKNNKIYLLLINILALWIPRLFAQNQLNLNEFALSDVSLLSRSKDSRDLNISVLLQYNLLTPYRKHAGLKTESERYPNWSLLNGHIACHYLIAL